MNSNALAKKVLLINKLATLVNAVAPNYFDVFNQFLGQKVVLASGSLSKKVRDLLPESVCNVKERIWLSINQSSIYLKVHVNIFENGDCQSLEESVGLCSLEHGLVSRVYPFEDRKSDWNVCEVEEKLKIIEEYQTSIERIKNTLPTYFLGYP